MKIRLFIFALALFSGIRTIDLQAQNKEPEVGPEKILMKTVAGDIVLGLYPDVAPKHVEQILKLVKAGVYDTTHFVRVHPNFVAQLANAEDRIYPMTPDQEAIIQSIPAEFSTTLKHKAGILSMARSDGESDSARTSFSVLLGPAPHLDGKYTIFGRVLIGKGVFEEFLRVPRDKNMKPKLRLTVEHAEIIGPEVDLKDLFLEDPHPIEERMLNEGKTEDVFGGDTKFFVYGFAILTMLSFLIFIFAKKGWTSLLVALSLLSVFIGTFYILILLTPIGQTYSWLGAVLFVFMLGVLKLMGRFEEPKK